MSEGRKKSGIFTRFLDGIEWLGNKLPHPVTLFAILALLTILLSGCWRPSASPWSIPASRGRRSRCGTC
nr:AbgT family transporter [Rubrobacter taiwanensis]